MTDDRQMHLALVTAYPTEADARDAIPEAHDAPYLGIWTGPHPEAQPVHVFGPAGTAALLEFYGWAREDA